jgi:probable rRNA maturation factor
VHLRFTMLTTREGRKHLENIPKLRSHLTRAVRRVAEAELKGQQELALNVILESDDELLFLNKTALEHDYYTDIITFELERTETQIEAELYISVERARENAERFGIDLVRELTRVVVHGLLHLAGYDDKDPEKKKRMQVRERFWLAQIFTQST